MEVFAFWEYFGSLKWLILYLIIINLITFVVYGIDKLNAVRGRGRVPNVTMFTLAIIGGSLGALLAMYRFRHKTRKVYYTMGIPMIMLIQAVVVFYAMSAGW